MIKDRTTEEVLGQIDLAGKNVLVTGASSGLGRETCRALATRGAHIVGAVRDLAGARGELASLAASAPGGLGFLELDLADLESVRRCAQSLLTRGDPFDVVICNAGVMATPRGTTKDGFETQFGVNHLGHFLFVNLVAPLLHSGSRVIVLSSMGHRLADIDLGDPNFAHRAYDEWTSYGASKTANVLFAVELDRRWRGRGIRAAAVHPGVVTSTALTRHMSSDDFSAFLHSEKDVHHRIKSIPEGAATTVWCAVVADANEMGGRYCQDCQVVPTNDSRDIPGVGPRAYAVDPARALTLWQISEELVGETFLD